MATRNVSTRQLMNLPQYKGMSEEEVADAYFASKNTDYERIKTLKDQMAEDYDLSDLNANDKAALDDLCTLFIRVDDLDQIIATEMRKEEPDMYNIQNMSKTQSQWRDAISKIQTDLSITRKARKGDNETSVVAAWESVLDRAKRMLDERLSYVYCEKCKMLLSTVWFLYPDVTGGNSIALTCGRDLGNGKICGHKTIVTSSKLKEMGNKNLKDVLPTA